MSREMRRGPQQALVQRKVATKPRTLAQRPGSTRTPPRVANENPKSTSSTRGAMKR